MPSVRFKEKSGAEKFFATSLSAMTIDYFRPLNFITDGDNVVVLSEESDEMDGIEGKLSNKSVQVYIVTDGLISRIGEFATSADPASCLIVR